MKNLNEELIALSSFFTTIIIISNIIAGKLINIGPFILTLSILIYPLSYTIANIISELYGVNITKYVIRIGFICSFFLVIISFITISLPPASIFKFNNAYKIVFGATPRIILASFLSYLSAQNTNLWIFNSLKIKNIYIRNIISMIFTQFIDSVVFIGIAFLGKYDFQILINMILSQYLIKLLISISNSPLISISVKRMKKQLILEQ